MAENELTRLRREMDDEMRVIQIMLKTHIVETDRRFGDVGRQLIDIGTQLGTQLSELGRKVARDAADGEERYNQLFGRMRLQDGRFSTFLGATDSLYADIDRRVTDIERRLGPPAA